MQKIDEMSIKICNISDDDDDDDDVGNGAISLPPEHRKRNFVDQEDDIDEQSYDILQPSSSGLAVSTGSASSQEQRPNKLIRTRAPVNQPKPKDSDTLLMETSLMIINPSPILPSVHSSHHTKQLQHEQQQLIKHQQQVQEHQLLVQQLAQQQHTQEGARPPLPLSGSQHQLNQQQQQQNHYLQNMSSTQQQPQIHQPPYHHYPPPLQPPSSSTVTEPEIVLSPAKLGQ